MSENIQSISQGTFAIGQTSATNFIAGPGIKVDQPSEGVVRIGNDETVLWSGNSTVLNTTFNLSEPYTNFEKIRFKHCFEGSGVFVPMYTDYDTDVLKNAASNGIGLSYNGCKAQSDLAGWNLGLANIVKVSDTQLSGGGAGYFALNAKSLITSNIYYIYEIRGINRISNA